MLYDYYFQSLVYFHGLFLIQLIFFVRVSLNFNKYLKSCSISLVTCQMKLKPQWDTSIYFPTWLKLEVLIIPIVGKAVNILEFCCWWVNQYNYCKFFLQFLLNKCMINGPVFWLPFLYAMGIHAYVHHRTCTRMLTETLFIIVETGNNPISINIRLNN